MAAPQNIKERKRIYRAAIKLFGKCGYAKTTYSDIAKACATTKSMVQHYYPKKDLFVEAYFEEHLAQISAQAQERFGEDALHVFCAMGLLHFNFLLSDGSMKAFCDDVVASRELTSTIIGAESAWAIRLLGDAWPNDARVSAEDALATALGGAYELVFRASRDGRRLDALYVERAAFVPFALNLGYPRREIEKVFTDCQAVL